MTSSFGMGSHQATLEEDVTLLNGQTSSSLTGRTSGLPQGQLHNMGRYVPRFDQWHESWEFLLCGFAVCTLMTLWAACGWGDLCEHLLIVNTLFPCNFLQRFQFLFEPQLATRKIPDVEHENQPEQSVGGKQIVVDHLSFP